MTDTKQKEIWKTYPEFPFIEASNLGRIRTKDRIATDRNGKKYHIKGRILKQWFNHNGYLHVSFRANGKVISLRVHRVVAACFLPNPDNLPEVNHIDNDRTNNAVSNLEWCTSQYNSDYKKNFGTSQVEVLGRPVIAIDIKTSEIFWFKTQAEAARQLEASQGNISSTVNGKLNKTHDHWLCRVDENAVEKTRAKFDDDIARKVEELIGENYD